MQETEKTPLIWIKHRPESEDKKEHIHALVVYENPSRWETVLDRFECTPQFCRPLEHRLNTAFCYLTHANQPGKVQYSVDDLRGDGNLIAKACSAIRAYTYGHELLVDTVPVAIDWIMSQCGRFISPQEFAKSSIRLGFFKAANNSLVRQVLHDHNVAVAASAGVDLDKPGALEIFGENVCFGDIRHYQSADLEAAVND